MRLRPLRWAPAGATWPAHRCPALLCPPRTSVLDLLVGWPPRASCVVGVSLAVGLLPLFLLGRAGAVPRCSPCTPGAARAWPLAASPASRPARPPPRPTEPALAGGSAAADPRACGGGRRAPGAAARRGVGSARIVRRCSGPGWPGAARATACWPPAAARTPGVARRGPSCAAGRCRGRLPVPAPLVARGWVTVDIPLAGMLLGPSREEQLAGPGRDARPRPGRGWSTPPRPSAAGSSATCTTAPSSGWSRSR